MKKKPFVGVDGCRAGWFAVAFGTGLDYEFQIYKNIEELWREYTGARAILIDIPIGLVSGAGIGRECDSTARKILKPLRHSSVFTPPCREALSASSHEEACRINEDVCGKKISIMAWGICPKIKEVDDFLQRVPEARVIFRETHPEVCFWALNRFKPMAHYKRTREGVAERLALLEQTYPRSRDIFHSALKLHPRRLLARDDIIDALVNAVTALHLDDPVATLPEIPPVDALGYSMEMVYATVDGLVKS